MQALDCANNNRLASCLCSLHCVTWSLSDKNIQMQQRMEKESFHCTYNKESCSYYNGFILDIQV